MKNRKNKIQDLRQENLEDTLEFISLDDETIESYNDTHMSAIDRVVAVFGFFIVIVAAISGTLYVNAKVTSKQLEAFAEIGSDIEGIEVIGERGLIAVSDAESARLSQMIELEQEQEEEKEEETKTIEVGMNVTSIQSDIKIKFVNKETNKLIANVPFEVEVTGSKNKVFTLKDDDKDGIIYQTGVDADTYTIKPVEFKSEEFAKYQFAAKTESIKVTDTIAYKKVDVADEIKSESKINAAAEDTAQQTETESTLTDTVEWVESTKTEIESDESYKEISKADIPNPSTSAKAVLSSFMKLVEVDEANESENQTPDTETNNEGIGDSDPANTETGDNNGDDSPKTDKEKLEALKPLLAPTSVTIKKGESVSLIVSTEVNASYILDWSSSNTSVALVENNGTVTGVAAGSATVMATIKIDSSSSDFITLSCSVTVESDEAANQNGKDVSSDTNTKLKDKNGNQICIKNSDGKYVEATYADYFKNDRFYIKSGTVQYRYTGWQTIDGSVYFYDKNGNYVTGDQVIQGARYTFGSDGKLSSGSGTMGIDVSKHNGNIDWNAVKNSGVSFVIIRCGYRGSATGVLVEDPMFRSNIKGAKAAGLKVGVYFFCQAVNEVEAVEEASMAVSLVSGYGLDMPIFLDVESAQGGRGDKISKETRTAVCKAFCATVQDSGYSAGIYANKTWLNEKINIGSLTSYKIWLAQYASAPTYTTTRYDMWQYSSKGRISGISTDVDLNIRYY